MTGETGTGKSMLVDSVLALSGGVLKRGRSPLHRRTVVEATFILSQQEMETVSSLLQAGGIEAEGDTLTLRREIVGGRSRYLVNDQVATASLSRALLHALLIIQTQHSVVRLRTPAFALELVDAYAETHELVARHRHLHEKVNQLQKQANECRTRLEQLAATADYDREALAELEAFCLTEEALQEMERKRRQAQQSHKITEVLTAIHLTLSEQEGSILERLHPLIAELHSLRDVLPGEGVVLLERLQTVYGELEELARDALRLANSEDASPEELARIEQTLSQLNALLFKHRARSVEELRQKAQQLTERLTHYQKTVQELEQLKEQLRTAQAKRQKIAEELTEKRLQVLGSLEKRLNTLLHEINMGYARLKLAVEKMEMPAPAGNERITVLYSNDGGKHYLPAHRALSGGELSRVFLAFQFLIAEKHAVPTLILDEVDTGLSGETAQLVAQLLERLACRTQIICITHLPAIAARATTHIHLCKEGEEPVVECLSSVEQRAKAIATMMAGASPNREVIEAALQLLGRRHSAG